MPSPCRSATTRRSGRPRRVASADAQRTMAVVAAALLTPTTPVTVPPRARCACCDDCRRTSAARRGSLSAVIGEFGLVLAGLGEVDDDEEDGGEEQGADAEGAQAQAALVAGGGKEVAEVGAQRPGED